MRGMSRTLAAMRGDGQDGVVIPISAELIRDALETAGQLPVPVRGGSMGPWIRSGDTVVVERAVDVRAGEVLVFERDGRLIAHRVIARTEDGWITRGDAVERSDLPVGEELIVGRVRGLHLRCVTIDEPSPWLRRAAGRLLGTLAGSLNHVRARARGGARRGSPGR